MPESERPRRAVPAWVTAPPEDAGSPAPSRVVPAGTVADRARPGIDAVPGLEAHPTPAPPVLDPNAVVPDFPPTPELLPPAPTSPNVDTLPFSAVAEARATVAGLGPADATATPAGTRDPAADRTAAGDPRATARHGAARRSATDAQASAGAMAMPAAPVVGAAHASAAPVGALGDTGDTRSAAPVPAPAGPVASQSWSATPDAGVPTAPTAGPAARSAGRGATTATPAAPPAPAFPVVPAAGQPRFSVPGLEHVVVEGGEPEAVGPIGYRTPARFARQQARVIPPAVTAPPTFDAVLATPAPTTAAPFPGPASEPHAVAPVVPAVTRALPSVAPAAAEPAETATSDGEATHAPTPAREHRNADRSRGANTRRGFLPKRRPAQPTKARSTAVPVAAGTTAQPQAAPPVTPVTGADTGLQAGTGASATRARRPIGATPGAVLGALAGLATLGLAAWWFTAPATVHAVGVLLGVLAVVVSVVTMRNPASTWQRPVALLGTVLGAVGTLVLLWAVASALGAPLPDLTGTGATPTIAP
ncbi:hypothetical protein DEJ16_13415 [Curtobacterium sp. MCJR17_055]|nr:hypothetical protein DEJ16_13415 [Curtobacterium sp. MCJR17_055]